MLNQTKERLDKVLALRKNGVPVQQACKEVKMSVGTFYSAQKAMKKKARKSPRKLLNITELPSFVPKTGNLFMVYGSPEMLANFAKGMS